MPGSMTDQALKDHVSDLLRSWHFEVDQLPERRGQRTPDLLVSRGVRRFVVELKGKADDTTRLRNDSKRLVRGEVVEHAEPAGRRNTISGIVEDAVDQIAGLPPAPEDLRLLWLHGQGRHPDLKVMQFHATVYGTTNIIDLDNPSRRRECYFFYHNEFFRFREGLDGAVLAAGDQVLLCINHFSQRADLLRTSPLAVAFRPFVCDPVRLEEEGEVFIADCDIDRRRPEEVIQYVRRKYGCEKLMNMDMGLLEASMLVTFNDERE